MIHRFIHSVRTSRTTINSCSPVRTSTTTTTQYVRPSYSSYRDSCYVVEEPVCVIAAAPIVHTTYVQTTPSYYYPYLSASAQAAKAQEEANAKAAEAERLKNELEATEKNLNNEIAEISSKFEQELSQLDSNLKSTEQAREAVKNELDATRDDLHKERTRSKSMSEAHHNELEQLNACLAAATQKLACLEPRAELANILEKDISELKDEIKCVKSANHLLADQNQLQSRIIKSRACSPVAVHHTTVHYSRPCSPVSSYVTTRVVSRPCSPPSHVVTSISSRSCSPCHVTSTVFVDSSLSPLSPRHCTQVIRQDSLIKRFDDLYALNRLNAMDILRNYSSDYENNQRIILSVIQEAFSAAKRSFADWKIRVRSSVAITHSGPDTLEEAVQAYINRNIDLYDLPYLTSEVIAGLNRNPKITLPCGVTYCGISSFIRESCRLSWEMSTLAHPLDIAFAMDNECLDDCKYRRTYDSDYSAPLVNNHVWPALVQGPRIVSKGEACTRRTQSLVVTRCEEVQTTTTRCVTPIRSCLRDRSISPFRFYRSKSCHFH